LQIADLTLNRLHNKMRPLTRPSSAVHFIWGDEYMLRKTALSVALVAAVASGSAFAGGRSDLVLAALQAGQAEYVPGEVIVQFDANASAGVRNAVARGLNARVSEVVREAGNGKGEMQVMSLPPGLAIADAVRAVDGLQGVDFIEPNWVYHHQLNATDPQYTGGGLWGQYGTTTTPANQFGSGAGAARGNNCSNVVIGIIDEGYMYAHADLAANAFKNPGDSTFDGVDNDGNGLVDDVYGWDFDGNNSSLFDGVADDHGTHVAGTIGGVGNNGVGVAGVCHSVKLMGAKFLGSRGGTTANAIKAVDYFTDLKTRHNLNLVATNNSWGGGGFSQALKDAIDRANAAGILFIAAAGNSGANNDATAAYPSGYTSANVIAVAALTNTGALASYSQYGATTVDICAPGSGIVSTVPAQARKNAPITSGYASYNGTSMATPHVTGGAALYAALNPGSSAAQIKSAILNNAVATPSCNGKVATNGRLNVAGF
jgi:subtilisin family serine protease